MIAGFPELTAAEAASLINTDDVVGFGGFTPAGSPKAVSREIAQRALTEHAAGRPFSIGVITGASTGPSLDGVLAQSDAVKFRTPYQSDPDLRKRINTGKTQFFDMHLSQLPQAVRYGFLGEMDWAIVEVCDVKPSGEVTLTSSVGASPTFLRKAKRVILERNKRHPSALRGFHDIYEPEDPPTRKHIPIYHPEDRIGTETIHIDPAKIAGVVETDLDDEVAGFDEPNDVTRRIGENVADFLAGELRAGRISPEFLPIQSGVGNIANAVLFAMGGNPGIPPFRMYTEVIQDSVVKLMRDGRILFASGSSLTLSNGVMKDLYRDLEQFRGKILLRPQEISNNPEIVRRLGIISINTALELDLYGNVNSTHVMGRQMMNGIGGSGDFTRNAYISIFTCPSSVKGGKISPIVPMVSHLDHSEHSVQVIATENGVADLRGKSPHERAQLIIENCAHADYRPMLREYLKLGGEAHTPQSFDNAYALHRAFLVDGDMRKARISAQ
ncbi:MAG: succinate CoA transferase [Chthoniobacterales bacterium]|nr:succinate CoA transferase [Chthoniobacterales bacterium]